MKFIKETSPDKIASHLAEKLNAKLKSGSVLWLLSGGSSITISAMASRLLDTANFNNLTIAQVDERYGLTGHADSNWQQLLDAGLVTYSAKILPVLNGQSLPETVHNYNNQLDIALNESQFKIGFFGIGGDGHTAGILPNSAAISSPDLVTSYQGPDFMRITLTPKAIARLDIAVVYAAGESKHQALKNLQQEQNVYVQPAQALKTAKQLVIFNDIIGEEL